MDTGRLGAVRRQENSRRKFVILLNGALKTQYDVVHECLSREKFEAGVRYDKTFMPIRRAIVRQRVLQRCLQIKRQNRNPGDRRFGVYGGKPLYSFSRDIDKFITENHPKLRRSRETEHALKEGMDQGKILDPAIIPAKIEKYFEKNWKTEKVEIKQKPKLPKVEKQTDIFTKTKNDIPIGGLLNSYNIYKRANEYTDLKRTAYEIDEVKPFNDSLLFERSTTKESNTLRSREPTRGLLILPPIQTSKAIAQR